jgi:DNA-binding response OmpR family regulator
MALIYSADDEKEIRDIIKIFLESDGHEVKSFETGDQLLEVFRLNPCDLVLLDVMMPGTDGFMITNQIRKTSAVPIILLTAKDEDSDYIAGLSLGSDDYMTKPFKPSLLVAKVNALLRRIKLSEVKDDHKDISFGNLTYDAKQHQILCHNQPVKLTGTEIKFLCFMMHHVNEAVSKEKVLDEVWGIDVEIETRVADETNRRLRKKLNTSGADVYIQTVWGFGFKLTKKED